METEPNPPPPLDGLRVVEGCTFVAGPLAGMTLAQLGAQVIRFDPIGGSADRGRWPLAPDGTSLYWAGLNKNKQSICLDVRHPQGRELVSALITAPGPDSGILLTNAVGQRWLSDDRLRDRRPDLITVHIQGYADGTPAVDYTINARVGFPQATGPAEATEPINHLLPAWDVTTAGMAVTGLLAAERHRSRTGAGRLVEVALADVALAVTGHLGYLTEAGAGQDRQRSGNYVYGTYGAAFPTSDGRAVMVAAFTPGQWSGLCEVTGTQDALARVGEQLGVDLDDEGGRFEAREAITAALRPWFAERTLAEVGSALDRTRVLWSLYQTFRQLVDHDPLYSRANPVLADIDQPGIGRHLAPGAPLRFGGRLTVPPRPAPQLGADTEQVLAAVLGLSSAEIGTLQDTGVIDTGAGEGGALECGGAVVTDDDLHAWVGREQRQTERLCRSAASGLAALLDEDAPDDLPPLWHWAYFPERAAQSRLSPDGHPQRGDFLPPVPLPQRMFAGARLRLRAPLRLDEMVERRSVIDRVESKQGRSGPLTFVTVRHELSNDDGVALEEEQDLVYREASPYRPPERTADPVPDAPWQDTIVPDAVLLFRFSAVTFNAHRIHYDVPYATGVEGYPALVVHGPLQAVLLAELARTHGRAARVRTFAFRALSPAFADRALHVRGTPQGADVALDAYTEDGRHTMTATATFDRAVDG